MPTDEEIRSTPWSIDNNTLYKSRAEKDRWSDSYRLTDELNFGTGYDAAVLTGLIERARQTQRSEIILPRGNITLETTLLARNPLGTNPLRIVGQGPDVTLLRNTAADQTWMQVGDRTVERTKGLIFEGFSYNRGVEMGAAGRCVELRNCSDIVFRDVTWTLARNAVGIGLGAAQPYDVAYVDFIDCGALAHPSLNGPLIKIGSAGAISFKGGRRWNAGTTSAILIQHTDAAYYCDGLYVYNLFAEGFGRYLYSGGLGVYNMVWVGGQVDSFVTAFHAESAVSGGSNRQWRVQGLELLPGLDSDGAGSNIGFLITKGSSTNPRALENIKIYDCTFKDLTGRAVWAPHGETHVRGNIMDNCGHTGTPLIQLGGGNSNIESNFGKRYPGCAGPGYTYGIEWVGASNPTRFAANNRFLGFSAAATTGTQ